MEAGSTRKLGKRDLKNWDYCTAGRVENFENSNMQNAPRFCHLPVSRPFKMIAFWDSFQIQFCVLLDRLRSLEVRPIRSRKMGQNQIQYSEKYCDDTFEYRYGCFELLAVSFSFRFFSLYPFGDLCDYRVLSSFLILDLRFQARGSSARSCETTAQEQTSLRSKYGCIALGFPLSFEFVGNPLIRRSKPRSVEWLCVCVCLLWGIYSTKGEKMGRRWIVGCCRASIDWCFKHHAVRSYKNKLFLDVVWTHFSCFCHAEFAIWDSGCLAWSAIV